MQFNHADGHNKRWKTLPLCCEVVDVSEKSQLPSSILYMTHDSSAQELFIKVWVSVKTAFNLINEFTVVKR
jgi:hypothetical protein